MILDQLISNAFAQEVTTTAATAGAQPPSPFGGLWMIVIMFVVFYFLLIRPQQKRIRQHKDMIDALRRGDKVVTGGGIIGTIAKVENDDILLVEIAPDVKVRVARQSISNVVNRTEPADSKKSKNANDNSGEDDGEEDAKSS